MKQITEGLFALQDEEYRAFHAKLIPNISYERIIGVRTPALRKYAKEVAKMPEVYDFLEELLFLHEIEFMLFSEFKVMIDKIDDGYHLNATIEGEDINWDKHYRGDEVKAITFHKMNIVEGNAVKLSAIVDL